MFDTIITVVFLVGFVALVIASRRQRRGLRERGLEATAHIYAIDRDAGEDRYFLHVVYLADGAEQQATLSIDGHNPHAVGDTIPIVYDPKKPYVIMQQPPSW